ncbi:MAG: hypothetical protein M1826_001666 [Phylliscum demangeonii]|nr:MAG: hypothetical protein M1826_001666 [Phylliscum demangeonii]
MNLARSSSLRQLAPLVLHPPSTSRPAAIGHLRFFTQHPATHLLALPSARPQLPFLYPPSCRGSGGGGRRKAGEWRMQRLLTTAQKAYFRNQFALAGKIIVYTALFGISGMVLFWAINEERAERRYPSPPEWPLGHRAMYHSAKVHEEPEAFARGVVDWILTGNMYQVLAQWLEDPAGEGRGLLPRDEARERHDGDDANDADDERLRSVLIAAGAAAAQGAWRPQASFAIGYDVGGKSEAWRRGYYETLMGAGRGAENLDGFVRDDTRQIVFPPEMMIGPSNPDPRPCPPDAFTAPLEEHCSPAFEPASFWYAKILTTRGFGPRQRVLAALAYADWLDFKQQHDAATEVHRCALAIAAAAAAAAAGHEPGRAGAGAVVVDVTTGVIGPEAAAAAGVTANVLLASTALATHHARTGDVSAALAIYLSVLRARRALPAVPPPAPSPSATRSAAPSRPPGRDAGMFTPVLTALGTLFTPAAYPAAPPSGDQPAWRTPASICHEAAVMAHIGEVLFARSSRADGLTWTREAVDVAEAQLDHYQRQRLRQHQPQHQPHPADPDPDHVPDPDGNVPERCSDCLDVALDNWRQMVALLLRDQRARERERERAHHPPGPAAAAADAAPPSSSSSTSWSPRLWRSTTTSTAVPAWDDAAVDWEAEMTAVEQRARRIQSQLGHLRPSSKKGAAWLGSIFF